MDFYTLRGVFDKIHGIFSEKIVDILEKKIKNKYQYPNGFQNIFPRSKNGFFGIFS